MESFFKDIKILGEIKEKTKKIIRPAVYALLGLTTIMLVACGEDDKKVTSPTVTTVTAPQQKGGDMVVSGTKAKGPNPTNDASGGQIKVIKNTTPTR